MREQTLKRLPTTIFGDMKRLGYILGGIAIGAILFIGSSAHAQVANSYWKLLGGTILPNIDSWTLTLPFLGSSGSPCVDVTSTTGLLGTTTCGGGGSGTVTSITAGTGLTGGTITTSGTIALSVPVSIANGGTATTSAVTNGVYYYNGSNAEADGLFTYVPSTANLSIDAGDAIGSGALQVSGGLASVGYGTINPNLLGAYLKGSPTKDAGLVANGNSFASLLVSTAGNVGIQGSSNATSTPSALLSIAGSAGGATPLFMVSSSTSGFATTTNFEIDSKGSVTVNNSATLTVSGMLTGSSGVTTGTNFVISNGGEVVSGATNILQLTGGITVLRNGGAGTLELANGTNGVQAYLGGAGQLDVGTTTLNNTLQTRIAAVATSSTDIANLFGGYNSSGTSVFSVNNAGNTALTGTFTLSAQGTGCATFTSGVLSSTGIACGSGSGGAGLSTTSPLSDSNLLVYSAAGAGSAYGAATTSPTFGLGLTKGGTWTVLGSAPTLALATSSLFTGATNQVPYFTGTNTLGASSNLTFDGNNLIVTGNASTTELGSTGYTYLATGASARVGIGTSTPSVKLDVNGTLRVYGSHPQLDLISSADVYNGVAGAAYVQTTNSYPLFLGVNNTNIIEVATTTNVGIGVINPQYKLDVNGTIGNSGAAYLSFGQNTYYNTNGIYLNSNGADYGAIQQITGTDGNGTWQLGYASVVGTPSPTLTWTGNGKVGIGLTNPAFTLDVKGIAGATSPFNVASSTGTSELVVVNSGNVGVSSSTPGSLLSIGTTNGINFSTGTSTFSSTGGIQLNGGCFALSNGTCIGGSGTVTSISGSGGSTGLTLTGGPITTSGTLTLGGTLGIANGGTGSTTLSGILLGNGTSAINTLSLGGDLSLSGTTLSGTNASTTQILITSSGTFTLPAGYTQFCVTAVAGGGGGGNSALNAGGGGGGAATTCFSTTTPITVSIGAGGTAGNSGGTTNVGGVAVASGGGPGGSAAGTSNTKATGGGGGCGTTGDALFCGDGGGEAVGLAVVGAVNGSGGGAPFFAGGGQAGAGAQSCGGGGGGGGAGFAGCALLSYKQ